MTREMAETSQTLSRWISDLEQSYAIYSSIQKRIGRHGLSDTIWLLRSIVGQLEREMEEQERTSS